MRCNYEGRLCDDLKFYPAKGNKEDRVWGRLAIWESRGRAKYINFSVFGEQARALVRHGSKGKAIRIQGVMRRYSDTCVGTYKEVHVETVQFGGNFTHRPPPQTCPLCQRSLGA